MTSLGDTIDAAADLLVARRPASALTGAGISVESGIPDFRSEGGLWERFDPSEYATIDAFLADPEKVWGMLHVLGDTVKHARPNAGHAALARLETLGVLAGVVTQNIDNLHQRAGSRRVVEFHGNAMRFVCMCCHRRLGRFPEDPERRAPRCPECDEVLKPDVVFFGEAIPTDAFREARALATGCGVMIVAGTSASVAPASTLPLLAKSSGAAIVEVNLERTPLTHLAELNLIGPAAEVLPALADAVAARLGA